MTYADEIKWFRANRGKTVRTRPATVEEQLGWFEKFDGLVSTHALVERSDWYMTAGREEAILYLAPAELDPAERPNGPRRSQEPSTYRSNASL